MLKKLLASICMICIVSDILSVCVGAEDISGGKLLETKYKAYVEEQQQIMEDECKKVEERYERIQKTKEYFEAYPNGNGNFVKSYYDENYNYVIQVKNAVTDQNLKDYIDKNNARIQYVKYSEEELEEIEQKCTNAIISYSNKVSLKDSELNELLNSNSEVCINYEDNCIDIYVNDKSDEAVQCLRKIVNNEAVRFVEKSKAEPTATTIQLGRGCYFLKPQGGYVGISIGYKAKMVNVSTGKVIYGFVSCGHMICDSINIGTKVYLDKECTKEIGKIKLITFNSDTACDYSFIGVNSDYTMSNRVYYSTSYGKTGDGTTLSNAYATEQELVSAQDAKVNIYKSGAASYLTSGEIISARRAVSIPVSEKKEVHLSKMVISKTCVKKGDSGGVAYAYMKHNGKYAWTIIGTVTATDDKETYFQPAYRNLVSYNSTYMIIPCEE